MLCTIPFTITTQKFTQESFHIARKLSLPSFDFRVFGIWINLCIFFSFSWFWFFFPKKNAPNVSIFKNQQNKMPKISPHTPTFGYPVPAKYSKFWNFNVIALVMGFILYQSCNHNVLNWSWARCDEHVTMFKSFLSLQSNWKCWRKKHFVQHHGLCKIMYIHGKYCVFPTINKVMGKYFF